MAGENYGAEETQVTQAPEDGNQQAQEDVQAEGTGDDGLRHVVGIAALRIDEEQGGGQSVGKAVKAAVVQVGPGEHGGGSRLAQRF